MNKLIWLAGTALSFSFALSATAQDGTDADPDEIIVTAQKRAENVQDVPIAIQVLAAENLETLAADNIGDIDNFVPGLDVSSGSPTQPRFNIRGIQTNDFGVGTDPAVGVYVDGVYAARSGASLLAFNDVERIEVVKGPQGTLFGRNSSAGAVSIITKKPSKELEGEIGLRYGNFNKRRVEAMLNVPLSDNLAVRLNGVLNKRDGLYEDATTGEDLNRQNNWAVRGQLGWELSPDTNVNLTYIHDEIDQDARPALGLVETVEYPGNPPVPPVPSEYFNPLDPDYSFSNDVINNSETRNLDEIVLNISHDFGDVTLTSISSYRDFQTNNREDEDGTNSLHTYFDTNNIEDNESFYQELRVVGGDEKFSWLAGVSYYDETAHQISSTNTNSDTIDTLIQNVVDGRRLFRIVQVFVDVFNIDANLFGHSWQEDMINRGDFKAYAAFADATFEFDDISLTLGGRYTRDEKTFSWINGLREAPEFDTNLLAAAGIVNALGASVDDFMVDFVFDLRGLEGVPCDNGVTVAEGVECIHDDVFTDFSPRVVLDYKLDDSTLLYASFAEGYKAGGYNTVEVASRFTNEDVQNIELGFKTTIDPLSLRLNGSFFNFKYDDKQTLLLVQDVAGSGVPQYLVQSTDEEGTGIDLEAHWAITENLGLMGNMQFIDLKFTDAQLRDGTDLSGTPTGEPKWSFAAGARY